MSSCKAERWLASCSQSTDPASPCNVRSLIPCRFLKRKIHDSDTESPRPAAPRRSFALVCSIASLIGARSWARKKTSTALVPYREIDWPLRFCGSYYRMTAWESWQSSRRMTYSLSCWIWRGPNRIGLQEWVSTLCHGIFVVDSSHQLWDALGDVHVSLLSPKSSVALISNTQCIRTVILNHTIPSLKYYSCI